jgi:hypothetical protein
MRKLHIRLPALLTASKIKAGTVKHKALSRYGKAKNHFRGAGFRGAVEGILAVIIILSFIALLALLWYNLKPVKMAEIKVPVATDKASYYAGQEVSGIFFGDIYHNGRVKVLREVFCKDYKSVIKPPKDSADGDFFDTQSRARHLEGESVKIGQLPQDIPLGSNCVLQFTNVYDIATPFGTRHYEYQYYTQNFSIVTKERREQLDNPSDTGVVTETIIQSSPDQTIDNGSGTPQRNTSTTNNSTTNNYNTTSPQPQPEPQPTPSEPVVPPKSCGFLGLGCLFN